MTKHCLISVTALGIIGSGLCQADILVNDGPPPDCPPCLVVSQPDLSSLSSQRFTLTSPVDITAITFWTYEVPDVASYPVNWSITSASNQTLGSGTDSTPVRDTPVLVSDLGGMGFDMQVSMITLDLPTPIMITPNPAPENYNLNLQFVVPSSLQSETLFYWAEGTNNQLAFQLVGSDEVPDPVVPEPSYLWLTAGGLGLLTAFRIRRKR
jgi:hypothetical protein